MGDPEVVKRKTKPINAQHIPGAQRTNYVLFLEYDDNIIIKAPIQLSSSSGNQYLIAPISLSKGNMEWQCVYDGRAVKDAKHVVTKFPKRGKSINLGRAEIIQEKLVEASNGTVLNIARYIDSGEAEYAQLKNLDTAIVDPNYIIQEFVELNEIDFDSCIIEQQVKYAREELQFITNCLNRGIIPSPDFQKEVYVEFDKSAVPTNIAYSDFLFGTSLHIIRPNFGVTEISKRLNNISILLNPEIVLPSSAELKARGVAHEEIRAKIESLQGEIDSLWYQERRVGFPLFEKKRPPEVLRGISKKQGEIEQLSKKLNSLENPQRDRLAFDDLKKERIKQYNGKVKIEYKSTREDFFNLFSQKYGNPEYLESIRLMKSVGAISEKEVNVVKRFFEDDFERKSPQELTDFLKDNADILNTFLLNNVSFFNNQLSILVESFYKRRVSPIIEHLQKNWTIDFKGFSQEIVDLITRLARKPKVLDKLDMFKDFLSSIDQKKIDLS